jgi:hypothetical protein
MRRERNEFNERVAKAKQEVAKADYHKLMHEYKHGRMADGDARQSNAVMHAIAPEHHREYFKHVDELARVRALTLTGPLRSSAATSAWAGGGDAFMTLMRHHRSAGVARC